jgi:hypothetical protein
MGLHCSFEHLKHKLWPKEGPGVKLAVWFPTTKSWESTRFTWVQTACDIPLESSWWKLQLCFRLHLHQRSSRKIMELQSCGSPSWHDFRTPETKRHLDVGPMDNQKVYYKGEGGGFPQVRAVVSLVCPCCSWFVLAPKVIQLGISHFVSILCRPVWVNGAYQFFLVPSRSSSMPRLLFLSMFPIWDSHLSPSRN